MHRIVLLALLAVLVAGPATAAKIYKWTDSDGRVHYGSNPPRGAGASQMDVRVSAPAPADQGGTEEGSAPENGDDGDPESSTETVGEGSERHRQQCETARQNLKALETGGVRSRYRNADGEVVRYTEEEIEAEEARNRGYLEEYCQDL